MLLSGGYILENGKLVKRDILIEGTVIKKIGEKLSSDNIIDVSKCWVIPGTIDIHAHFREPGYEWKGTVATESLSAAKGGITTALAMPNLNPAPHCKKNIEKELEIIKSDGIINILPYACVSENVNGIELSKLDELAELAVAFTDDGKGFDNISLLERAMEWAKANDKIICSHAEMAGYGTQPEAEYLAVKREIEMVKRIGCKYHFCHISTKKAFNAIKTAKLNGIDVSCEVTPHHLTLNETDICGNTNFKMNPPLRSVEDMDATVEALLNGTATIIATDHAPHGIDEKKVVYPIAPNGIIGFETTLPVCYTALIKNGKATYDDFLKWLVYNPAKRFGLIAGKIEEGENATLAVLDIENERIYGYDEILSKGKNSPFIGRSFYGFNRLTIFNGKIIYQDIF